MTQKNGSSDPKKTGTAPTPSGTTPKPAKQAMNVFKVKTPSERYSGTKAPALTKAGTPGMHRGKALEMPSQRELAMTGAWIKSMCAKSPLYSGVRLTEHEKQLLLEMSQGDWIEFSPAASADGRNCWVDKSSAPAVKAALLDDTGSGDQYLNPLWFDTNVVLPALLSGELFPAVDVVEQPRGKTINTARIGHPTATWGTAEGTAMTAFDATSLVAQIAATVFPVSVYIELGRDMISDSDPLTVGSLVQAHIGARMQAELDKVIAVGDGTTQPQGIFTASGLTALSSDNSAAGPPTVSDVESLIFGIGKQYRQAPYNPFLLMNDVTYRRFSSIPVGPTDERRVFGNNSSIGGTQQRPMYRLYEHEVKIANDVPNTKMAFLPGQAYRLWRRQGFETQVCDTGNWFMARNLTGIVVRGRFAGKVVLPEAVATMTDLQS